ncbi:MAG: hypothetical protein U0936_13435 [Planctomycetaceae bacterium]
MLLPAPDVLAQVYMSGPQRSMSAYRAPHASSMNSAGSGQVYQPQQHPGVKYVAEPVIDPVEMPVKTYEPTSYDLPDPAMQRPPSPEMESAKASGSSSTRAGLLGQSYLDARFMWLSPPHNGFVDGDSVKVGLASLNLPIAWPNDETSLFHQDMFVEFMYLANGDKIPGVRLDHELIQGAIGTTLFADATDWCRPFLQVGGSYRQDSVNVNSPIIHFQKATREYDMKLLLRGGAEFDLAQNLAFRIAAGNEQLATAELITWPSPRIFFRLGGVMEFDVHSYGGLAGVGFTY